jgi:hypothetical protein
MGRMGRYPHVSVRRGSWRSEQGFQGSVVACAEQCGWLVLHTQASFYAAGFPDLLLMRGTRIIFAELKMAGYCTSPAQDAWLARLQAHGETYLWYDADMPEIRQILAKEEG